MAGKIITPAQAMLLPDCCFGRRWPIIFSEYLKGGETRYYISELGLPEWCVIWQLFASIRLSAGMVAMEWDVYFTYKLGDQTPTAANFGTLEPLFKGVDQRLGAELVFAAFNGVLGMRQNVNSQGRRICLSVFNSMEPGLVFTTGLVVSSVPKEIPEWLSSGRGNSL